MRRARATRKADVELGDIDPAPLADVLDRRLDDRVAGAGAIGADLQVAVGELRVGEAEPERERRLDPLGIEPAVADEQPLLVADDLRDARDTSLGRRRSAGRPRGAGNVAGSRPPGSTSPNSTRANAVPPCWPGYQPRRSLGRDRARASAPARRSGGRRPCAGSPRRSARRARPGPPGNRGTAG